MSNERKRVKVKPVKKLQPKKREEAPTKKKTKPVVEVEVEKPKEKKPKGEDKYIRIPTTAKSDEFRAMSERVQLGEVKWAYYATDGDKGYHHYLVI